MKLKFKNITKCSKQIYYEFLEFHNKKYGKKEKIHMICMFLAVGYMIIFNIMYYKFNFAVALALIGIVCLLIHKIRHKYKAVQKELKSSKVKNEEEIIYNFYERYFEIVKNNNVQKMRYFKLYKIHQDNLNFYFYIDETHALIINKKGFVQGSLSEFKKFISKKCMLRYKKN